MKNTKITFKIDLMLFIIFLILKLDGITQWKWVWVFAPIWSVWLVQACITIVTVIANRIAEWEYNCSTAKSRTSGPRLAWDPKTNTMYGPFDNLDDEE